MRRLGTVLGLAAALVSCRETTLVPPVSLDGPSAIAIARGNVCLTTFEDLERVVRYEIGACADDEIGAIGLVVNEQNDRLALMDLSGSTPRLVDLDPLMPGPNHLEVGRLPVDVAASPDGTVAYTLNQLDRDVSVVDLWTPAVLPARLPIDDTPIALDVDPITGEVVVAAGSPSRLYAFEGHSFCGPGEPCEGSPSVADAEARTLDLPGTVSDFVFSAQGSEAWVVYRDLEYASVIAFGPTPDGADTACLSGADQKPCVVAHVSLGFGCSDGLDNDGDGSVDQQDSQCFGPRGAESPEGLGRMATDACSNGIDDDMDGLVDRDDPECALASGVDEATGPFIEAPLVACNDGVDADADGNVDFPNDNSCYGPFGRTETSLQPVGFDAIGTDTHGMFVYIADRSGEQVLVLDARRKQLIDAPAAQLPGSDAIDSAFGIDVAPSPLSVQGAIDRRVTWVDPENEDHVIVRYDFGAWLSANNGSIQYVDTLVSFCEFTGDVVNRDAFWRGEQSEEETKCLELPVMPLETASARVVANDPALPAACTEPDFVACATCLEAGDELCESCLLYADTQFDLCQRAFAGDVTSYVNPRFALRDGGGDDGRLLGTGTCEQPEALLAAMQQHAQANPTGPQDLKCDSLLMPQPLAPQARSLTADDVSALAELGRAELVQLHTLQFDTENENAPLVGIRPSDQRILNEPITTSFEGVIPGTIRSDGLFASSTEDDDSIWFDIGFDPCARGVAPGDRMLITSEPNQDCDATGFEYEIVEVTTSEVRVAPIADSGDIVPVRGCYDTGVAYEVRANNEWLVVGETGGFLSPFESNLGRCVPRYGADRISSRVRTGELYEGPYYSLYLFEGVAAEEIQPVRDTSVTFQVTSGFQSVLFPTCSSLSQSCAAGLFPTQVLWAPGLPGGTLLLSPDPNDNFIHVRNLDDPAAGYTVVR